jgi:hypothetical protein
MKPLIRVASWVACPLGRGRLRVDRGDRAQRSEGNSVITTGVDFQSGATRSSSGSRTTDSDEQVVELFAKACSDRTKGLTFHRGLQRQARLYAASAAVRQGDLQLHQANAESRGSLPLGVSVGLTHT